MPSAGTPSGISKGEPRIQELVAIMEKASELRRQDEEIKRFLDDEVKTEIKERIYATAKETGEQLTDEYVDAAVDWVYDQLDRFKEPKPGFRKTLATLYVDRAKIGRRYGVPVVVLGVIASAAIGLTSLFTARDNSRKERDVEKRIERIYGERSSLDSQLLSLASTDVSGIVNSDELKKTMAGSQELLKSTKPFFEEFCSNGTADDDITQQNYRSAAQKAGSIEQTLRSVESNIGSGKAIIQTHNDILETRQGLDALIGQITSSNPPQVFMERAQSVYASGIASLDNRQLEDGKRYRRELSDIGEQAHLFVILPSELDKVYASIKAIATEPAAIDQADQQYAEARNYVETVNIPSLQQSLDKLKNMEAVLNQEYVVRVINKEGLKSGDDRYYTDKDGKRLSGYYLIMEALDANGNVLPQKIMSEETHEVKSVQMWGERVPQEVWEVVASDKQDNGIIEHDEYARKKRGYLTWTIEMTGDNDKPLERTGQITEWQKYAE
ncbi:MAG: DUF6384 family protein [Nanoarchaeota archaeon]